VWFSPVDFIFLSLPGLGLKRPFLGYILSLGAISCSLLSKQPYILLGVIDGFHMQILPREKSGYSGGEQNVVDE
jgi:hypothetical protein